MFNYKDYLREALKYEEEKNKQIKLLVKDNYYDDNIKIIQKEFIEKIESLDMYYNVIYKEQFEVPTEEDILETFIFDTIKDNYLFVSRKRYSKLLSIEEQLNTIIIEETTRTFYPNELRILKKMISSLPDDVNSPFFGKIPESMEKTRTFYDYQNQKINHFKSYDYDETWWIFDVRDRDRIRHLFDFEIENKQDYKDFDTFSLYCERMSKVLRKIFSYNTVDDADFCLFDIDNNSNEIQLISINNFKRLFENVSNNTEFEMFFLNSKDVYMIIKYDNKVSFQKCGNDAKEKYYNNIDELINDKELIISNCTIEKDKTLILKKNWDALDDIIINSEYSLAYDFEDIEQKYSVTYNKDEIKYFYVSVEFDNAGSAFYSYRCHDLSIDCGDRVIVEANGEEVVATVVDAMAYYEKDVPYPLDKAKFVISRAGSVFINNKK